jgi:predicted ATP-grasp superfamily ATP-dependent carboligase
MRILLSEGSSTSAREAITALGLAGHHLEVCDPDPHCLARFSRFVRRFHRCPGLAGDPEGYLAFILKLISGGHYDVLLPIHEQGFLFSRVRDQILPHVRCALPAFESYERAHSKYGFSGILSELGLPQPEIRFVEHVHELTALDRFPVVVKLAVGTASRGTWIVRSAADKRAAIEAVERLGGFEDAVIVQEFVDGVLEHAQTVFADGRLLGVHMYRQIVHGAGGGEAIKQSVRRPAVRAQVARIGEYLRWNGALSVDYVVEQASGEPRYIDCNPRLVEPMSAVFAGLDLADMLVRVSCGEAPAAVTQSQEGVRTHLAIQALLGCALREGSRLSLLRECWHLLAKRGSYAGSREELTPLRLDWPSFVPVMTAALWLLASPRAAHYLPQKGWGSHLLTANSMRRIRNMRAANPCG